MNALSLVVAGAIGIYALLPKLASLGAQGVLRAVFRDVTNPVTLIADATIAALVIAALRYIWKTSEW